MAALMLGSALLRCAYGRFFSEGTPPSFLTGRSPSFLPFVRQERQTGTQERLEGGKQRLDYEVRNLSLLL
jgi:hypothetical protein